MVNPYHSISVLTYHLISYICTTEACLYHVIFVCAVDCALYDTNSYQAFPVTGRQVFFILRICCNDLFHEFGCYRVSTTPGNLLEFKNPPGNPGNLLEFTGPPWNCCVRWSTALVSGHKTGYQVAYLSRNWSPYFIFATAPCCIKCISCDEHWLELIITWSIKCSRFGTLHSRPKQCKHVLDFSWNPSWSILEICSVKFDTLWMAVA